MADETPVDDIPDVSLVDNDLSTPLEATPSDTPAEQATDDGADTQEKPAEDTEPAAEGEQQPAQDEQPQQEDAATIKARNEAYARQRIQERARTRQAIAQQIDQNYAPKTEQDLVDEGYGPQQAQIEALRQEMNYREQRTQIAELNAGMQAEAVNIVNDFPIYNPNSPEYDAEFASMVEQQYKVAARLQTDENGIVVNAEIPLSDFYSQMATIYNRGASKGQQQGQQEYQQMLSRTENPGGSSSTTNDNSLEALEERLGNMVIT